MEGINNSEIKTFKVLESVLQKGLDGTVSIDQSHLVSLLTIFDALSQELSALCKKEHQIDVLKELRISEYADYIIEESAYRARCVELFLMYKDIPSEISNALSEKLPAFKELADIERNIFTGNKRSLEILQSAGVKPRPTNNSGCMIVLLVVIVFGAIVSIF